jgi:hypothetical protein
MSQLPSARDDLPLVAVFVIEQAVGMSQESYIERIQRALADLQDDHGAESVVLQWHQDQPQTVYVTTRASLN